jgi:PPM family protein phosphatase
MRLSIFGNRLFGIWDIFRILLLMMKFGFKSDKGRVREDNQDSYFVMPEEGVFLIADGVGGHMHGELASRTAITDIASFVHENPIPKHAEDGLIKQYFCNLIELVNEHVYALARQRTTRGMATTLIILYIEGNRAYALNVGDSRVYLIHEGIMDQVTEDHTFVNTLVKRGIISAEEAETHPDRNMITKAIGADVTVEPDFYTFGVNENDIILMCTDGLYNEMPSESILEMVEKTDDMRQLCVELVDSANNHGGSDNITVVSIKI